MKKKRFPPEEARRWFQQGYFDLKSARHSRSGRFYEDACFKSQQAVEKVLKAVLHLQRERYVAGHSCKDLLQRCEKYQKGFSRFKHGCFRLDKFYITSRYPNGLPSSIPHFYFDEREADEAIDAATEILDFVKSNFFRELDPEEVI